MENPDFYRKCLCYEELDWQVSTFHQLLDTMMMRHKNIWHRCDKHKAVETMKNILLLLTIFNIYSCKICWKECTNVNVVKVSVSGLNISNLRFVYICRMQMWLGAGGGPPILCCKTSAVMVTEVPPVLWSEETLSSWTWTGWTPAWPTWPSPRSGCPG